MVEQETAQEYRRIRKEYRHILPASGVLRTVKMNHRQKHVLKHVAEEINKTLPKDATYKLTPKRVQHLEKISHGVDCATGSLIGSEIRILLGSSLDQEEINLSEIINALYGRDCISSRDEISDYVLYGEYTPGVHTKTTHLLNAERFTPISEETELQETASVLAHIYNTHLSLNGHKPILDLDKTLMTGRATPLKNISDAYYNTRTSHSGIYSQLKRDGTLRQYGPSLVACKLLIEELVQHGSLHDEEIKFEDAVALARLNLEIMPEEAKYELWLLSTHRKFAKQYLKELQAQQDSNSK